MGTSIQIARSVIHSKIPQTPAQSDKNPRYFRHLTNYHTKPAGCRDRLSTAICGYHGTKKCTLFINPANTETCSSNARKYPSHDICPIKGKAEPLPHSAGGRAGKFIAARLNSIALAAAFLYNPPPSQRITAIPQYAPPYMGRFPCLYKEGSRGKVFAAGGPDSLYSRT